MAMERTLESERPVGWFVSRVVNLAHAKAESVGLLGGIVTPSGATLRIGERVPHGRELGDHESYAATLSFPGVLGARVAVELVVTRLGGSLVELGLRPVARVPQRRVGAERYFEAAWAVLEGVTRAGRDGAPASGPTPRGVRRLARAS